MKFAMARRHCQTRGTRALPSQQIERGYAIANAPLLPHAVFFALCRDLVSHLPGRIERMLGPIMFADRTRRGSLLRGGGSGDWGGRGVLFVTFLRDEKAAENGGDKQNNKGSHAPNYSRP